MLKQLVGITVPIFHKLIRSSTKKDNSHTSQKYLTQLKKVLLNPNIGFPYLWVNSEKYSFSQEVLDHGSRLMIEFFKLEHCLRDFYGKITQEPTAVVL